MITSATTPRLGEVAGVCLLAIGLAATTARAQVLSVVKDFSGETLSSNSGNVAIDDAGSVVFAVASSNQYGTNPGFVNQIFRWDPVAGTGEQLTNFASGVESVSVSDDGQWLAFRSSGDLTGDNHDQSLELFVMHPDGSALAQITNDTSLAGDGVTTAVISGSGNRVVFVADTNPLGTNPGRTPHLFVVDRDGTNLKQLADGMVPWYQASISDDGNRIAFLYLGAPGCTTQIFTSPADGSSPPAPVACDAFQDDSIQLSGNGATIVFGNAAAPSFSKVNWDGNALVSPLATGSGASITDDGLTVFYRSSSGDVRKIGSDGAGDALVAAAPASSRYRGTIISGDGSRIAVTSTAGPVAGGNYPAGRQELVAMDSSGGSVRQLTAMSLDPVLPSDVRILSNGTRIFFWSKNDPIGTNPDHSWEVFTMLPSGTGLAQVTNTTGNGVRSYSVTDAGVVVFETEANLTGQNACGNIQIYKINLGGTGLTQITNSCNVNSYTRFPQVSYNGQWVLWIGTYNNASGLYKMTLTGTSIALVSTTYGGEIFDYRMSATNPIVWVAYDSQGNNDGLNPNHLNQIARISLTPSNYLRITADPVYASYGPQISGDGNKIVWVSAADFVGANPDHSNEVFLYDVPTATMRQLSNTTGYGTGSPLITRDGNWVYWSVSGDSVRMSLATGELQRFTGFLRNDPPEYVGWDDVDSTGARTLVSGQNDIGAHSSGVTLFLADQNVKPKFAVGKAAPTLLSWDPDPQSKRYDVIRGDIANLSIVSSTVTLGTVTCLEDDSPDNQTSGNEDALQPNPGQTFFYLYRGTVGYPALTGSWGQATGGKERVAGGGSCNP